MIGEFKLRSRDLAAARRAAIRDGFRDRVYLETEPDLDPLRGRDDFKGLLREIGAA